MSFIANKLIMSSGSNIWDWNLTSIPGIASNRTYTGITYGGNKYVAVSRSFSLPAEASYSTDGITWTTPSAVPDFSWQAVTYGNNKFVAIAGGVNATMYSNDGITWTQGNNVPGFAVSYKVLTYGGGKFVAVSSSSGYAAYSTDGITWTQTSGLGNYTGSVGIAYGSSKFVVIGYASIGSGTASARYSNDGITWTSVTLPATDSWGPPIYGSGKFISSSASGRQISSNDGITWTEIIPVIKSPNIYGGTKFVYIPANYNISLPLANAFYSYNGTIWNDAGSVPLVPYSASNYASITYGTRFLAMTSSGAIVYSNIQ
jgi:hypothetical protein